MEAKKKPSRFVMEQWHLARSQSPPGSPPSTSDSLRQVVVSRLRGMVCGDDANTAPVFHEDLSSHQVTKVA